MGAFPSDSLMILKISSVLLFVHIICNINESSGRVRHLQFFMVAHLTVLNCSNNRFVVVKNWVRFRQSVLWKKHEKKCELSKHDAYDFSQVHINCLEVTQTLQVIYCFKNKSSIHDGNQHRLTDFDLSVSIGENHSNTGRVFSITNATKAFCAAKDPIAWNRMRNITYITMVQHPIFCRSTLNYEKILEGNKCHPENVERTIVCYHLLQSETILSIENFNWGQIDSFLFQAEVKNIDNLKNFGAHFIDLSGVK